jgi:ABC-type antimicrobial peptide transport system permease subunit
LNDTLAWIFNQNAGEIGFFMVDTSTSFSGWHAFTANTMTATGIATIVANDIRQAFQGYIDYATTLARVILTVLTVAAWISCAVLIKTVVQMNLDEKMREIGVLRAIGFNKSSIGEIVMSQLAVMIGIGVAAGLGIGLIPPNFFDVSKLSQFLSYNKVYAMDTITISISLLSTMISIMSGIVLPIIAGLVPLISAQKWSIVEMMSPSYMRQRHVNIKKNKKGRGKRS